MIKVSIRKQGDFAVMPIPSDVLRRLKIGVGSILELDVTEQSLTARPASRKVRKQYSVSELLRGVTPGLLAEVQEATEWARQGEPQGRELL
ncbi:MAG: antitoxin ChpS [Thermodesulfobacteriota bacterium]|nr:antitoxin ChpS [Thermodesulfobacteriota bacterium]